MTTEINIKLNKKGTDAIPDTSMRQAGALDATVPEVPEAASDTEAPADTVESEARKTSCCCSDRHKKRTPEEQKALLTRLRKIEGQIRGLERMVENDAYCPDILIQSSAATSALNSFNKVLLQCHIRGCVAEDIRAGSDETIDELCGLLQKLMK